MNQIEKKLFDLSCWLVDTNLASGDPFAFQCSDIGVMISKTSPKYAGGVLYRIDQKFPRLADIIFRHRTAPHSVALFVQACLLMDRHQPRLWGWRTHRWINWLLEHSNKEYPYTWGIPFKWLMGTGVLAPANTPMSTVTPYCSDAFYMASTSYPYEKSYLSVALSNANFIINSLNVVYEDDNKKCLSYSPLDDFRIVNVQAYCASQLYRAYIHTGNTNYKNVADKLINFVLEEQNEDGSWYYWSKQVPAPVISIDSLHQCYIMQGLYRCHIVNGDSKIKHSIERCVKYCKENLITDDLHVKKFSDRKHPYELIDAAEMVSTLDMFNDQLSDTLLESTMDKFAIASKSHFASTLNPRNNIPYTRWGQSQMLFTMAQHLALKSKCVTIQEVYT